MLQNNLKILIVEDDVNTCNRFQNVIDEIPEITLVGITNNAKKAVDLIQDTLPNAVILDLELHDGGGNGIEVLQQVKALHLPVSPFFLITTYNTSKITYDAVHTLGADFIMQKHSEDYSEKNVIHFLTGISQVILQNTQPDIEISESPVEKSKRLIAHIHAQLNLIGMSPKLKGYHYLTDAILLVYNGDTYHICHKIAAEYGKSESSVERAMQRTIDKTWTSIDIDTLSKYYTGAILSDKGTPTITEFIHHYATVLHDVY